MLVVLTFNTLFEAAGNYRLYDVVDTWVGLLRKAEHLGFGRGHFEACCNQALQSRRNADCLIHPR